MNINQAIIKLNELNALLKRECPTLELSLQLGKKENGHYYTNFEGINNTPILCLNNETECISSIILFHDTTSYWTQPDEVVFQLLSFTKKQEEGKKYNKLLRSVAIYIGNFITINGVPIKYYLSYAENPISAHLLTDYYSTEFPRNSNFYEYKNEEENKLKPLRQLFNDYATKEALNPEEERNTIVILLKLNEENITKSKTMFDALINMICVKGGKKRSRRRVNKKNLRKKTKKRHFKIKIRKGVNKVFHK
jgi:hypothetical protein